MKCAVDASLVLIVVYTSEPVKTRPVDDLTCSLGGEDETAVLSSTDSHILSHNPTLLVMVNRRQAAPTVLVSSSFRPSIFLHWFIPLLLLPCW